jgi:hypothetical protein
MFYLEFAVPKKIEYTKGPAIRIVEKEFDTLEIIKTKYKNLHDTQIFIQSKYETLFVAYRGDTTCLATKRIIAMHRFLDSCGK